MCLGHAHATDRITLEIEFDDDGGYVADHPAVMARFDRQKLGRAVLDHAAVSVFNVNRSLCKKPYMRMHAERGSADRLHVFRPAEPHWIHHPLDTGLACSADVEPHTANIASLGDTLNGGEQWIGCFRSR